MEEKIENIEKKKFNKKFILPLMVVFAIGLVVAGAMFYEQYVVNVNVNQYIIIDGATTQVADCDAGESCLGGDVTVSNTGSTEKTIHVSNDYVGSDIQTSYVGELEMTRKGLTDWIPIGDLVTISYTTIGDTFEVSGVPDGFTAVYYPNKNTYDYYDGVVVLSSKVGSNNLPRVDDLNGGSSSEYCTNLFNPTATQCKGAKLWLIPSDAVTSNVINWARASEFYFETELIQFNTNGDLVISPHSSVTFKPLFEVNEHALGGNYPVTITIA